MKQRMDFGLDIGSTHNGSKRNEEIYCQYERENSMSWGLFGRCEKCSNFPMAHFYTG